MFKLQTDQGEILISDTVLSNITGAAATSCYGVKGMAYRSMTDGIVHLLRG
ncbi:MAG: Asp23/Gls24 family envelope stress response protein, partial [Ruminococcaceae bacterium]|nr:Asp23/Gls24 family envelope stress response protein [Oscillospiraceae bacterium]